MTANSFTGIIETNGEFKSLESEASFTFTSGNTYTIQFQNEGYLKIADAEFYIPTYIPFTYKASEDTPYIKTVQTNTVIVILENSED